LAREDNLNIYTWNAYGERVEEVDEEVGKDCTDLGGSYVAGSLTGYKANEDGTIKNLTYNPWQNTTATVGVFNNTFLNPFQHVAISIGNGPFYGQNPKSDLSFLWHFAFGGPNSPGVPGVIKVQDPRTMNHSTSFPITGEQAAMIQNEINQSVQNPPPYDVYGPAPTCDCAFWIQNVLGGAGINTGVPTPYPMELLWQIDVATGQVDYPIPGGPYQ